MSLCLATAALAVSLAVDSFTVAWTHSVERTEWRERWRIEGHELVLDEARVRGSGAGMEPPDGSVLQDGWWVYRPALRVLELNLAVSGATGRGWQLCTEVGCDDLEAWLTLAGKPPAALHLSSGHGRRSCRLHPPTQGSGTASGASGKV